MSNYDSTVVAPLIVGLILLLVQQWLKSGKK
ncbi:type I toxin-antitoxin system Fst family toxin [Latilactobacillus curvatus]|nr:type I toxin-antitoxin system Fst family toxin [Latilactobacillus curvatus]